MTKLSSIQHTRRSVAAFTHTNYFNGVFFVAIVVLLGLDSHFQSMKKSSVNIWVQWKKEHFRVMRVTSFVGELFL